MSHPSLKVKQNHTFFTFISILVHVYAQNQRIHILNFNGYANHFFISTKLLHIEELESCIILEHICNELFLQIKNIAPNPSPCKTSGNPPKNSPIYHKQNFGIVAQAKTLEVVISWKKFWVDSFDFLAFALAVVREADLGGSVRPSFHQLP